MATYAERQKIERDSRLDPDGVIPADTTQAEVAAANVFRNRVRSAVLDVAVEALAISPIPASGPGRDAIGWARGVLNGPDVATGFALRLLLAHFDAFTPTQILAPAVTDQAIHDAIVGLVPAMALGSVTRQ